MVEIPSCIHNNVCSVLLCCVRLQILHINQPFCLFLLPFNLGNLVL